MSVKAPQGATASFPVKHPVFTAQRPKGRPNSARSLLLSPFTAQHMQAVMVLHQCRAGNDDLQRLP